MVVIFSRPRRAMLGEAFRYLEHLHTTSENGSRATLKKFTAENGLLQRLILHQNILTIGNLKKLIFFTFSSICHDLDLSIIGLSFFRRRVKLC